MNAILLAGSVLLTVITFQVSCVEDEPTRPPSELSYDAFKPEQPCVHIDDEVNWDKPFTKKIKKRSNGRNR